MEESSPAEAIKKGQKPFTKMKQSLMQEVRWRPNSSYTCVYHQMLIFTIKNLGKSDPSNFAGRNCGQKTKRAFSHFKNNNGLLQFAIAS